MLVRAQQCLARQRSAEAETVLRQILSADSHCREALELSVVLYLQTGRPDEAQHILQQLVALFPAEPLYCERLATLLTHRGRAAEAIHCYRQLLEQQPQLVNSRYNLARLLRQEGHLEAALAEYQRTLTQGIAQPEEVQVNIAALYSESGAPEDARRALRDALSIRPDFPPAIYNLALLEEECGEWSAARDLYQQLLTLEPGHVEALARLAYGDKATSLRGGVPQQLLQALGARKEGDPGCESLCYALGKVHDDCAQYSAAFAYYDRGNQLSVQRAGPYDRRAQEVLTEQLMLRMTPDWLHSVAPVSTAPLLFICGMFRSGSTLLEQILGGHPQLTAGGEIRFFNSRLSSPMAVLELSGQERDSLGRQYLQQLALRAAGAAQVIDKQPDNFWFMGLLAAMYPKALFINTVRHPLDNGLSIYFQQLDQRYRYANRLADIGHYYCQYQRLLNHWRGLLPDNLVDVAYEDVVAAPRATIEPLLNHLGLPWHRGCEEFYAAANQVRTASVWQVRQPLYSQSVARWRHYGKHLQPLADILADANLL